MENIGIKKMQQELVRLNPKARFAVNDYTVSPHVIIYGDIPGNQLVLPHGYYYNEKNCVTDKHNTGTGLYEVFEYSHDVERFAKNRH